MAAKKAAAGSDLPKLAAPAQRALAGASVKSLAEISRMTEAEVAALHGIGPNAMKTLKDAMNAKKLSFAKR